MEQILMNLLEPGTFMFWGLSLVLVFRLHVRRHGNRDRRRTMFG